MNSNEAQKKQVKSFFERYSFHGENLSELTTIPHLRQWLAWIENKKNAKSATLDTASYFLSEIPHAATVLDFGCGSGWAMMYMLHRKPDVFVVGIDIARNPIKEAKNKAEKLGVKRSCEFVLCDCTHIPFRKGVFDASVDLNVIHHLSGIHEGLMGIYRVLKIGGYVLMLEVVTNNLLIPIGRRLSPFLRLSYSSGIELGFTSDEMAWSIKSTGFRIVRKSYDDYVLETLKKLAVRYPQITNAFPKPIVFLLIYLDLLLQRLPILQRSGGMALFMCQK